METNTLILIYLFAPITILLFFYGLLEDSYLGIKAIDRIAKIELEHK